MTLIRHVAAALCLAAAPAALASGFSATENLDARQPVAAVQALQSGEWLKYVEAVYAIPSGFSYSPNYDFGVNGARLDAVRAELFVQRGDICNAALYSIDVATTPTQPLLTRYYPDASGTVSLPNATVYQVVVVLQQSSIFASRCVLRLSGLSAGGDGGGGDTDFSMVGSLSYDGGLSQQDIPANGAKVSQFWVRVPDFCAGLEVLEAGTVTEGQYDKARLVDANKRIFAVNGGAGARVGAIRLILNGPRDLPCDVPVYGKVVP